MVSLFETTQVEKAENQEKMVQGLGLRASSSLLLQVGNLHVVPSREGSGQPTNTNRDPLGHESQGTETRRPLGRKSLATIGVLTAVGHWVSTHNVLHGSKVYSLTSFTAWL